MLKIPNFPSYFVYLSFVADFLCVKDSESLIFVFLIFLFFFFHIRVICLNVESTGHLLTINGRYVKTIVIYRSFLTV